MKAEEQIIWMHSIKKKKKPTQVEAKATQAEATISQMAAEI